MKKNKKKMRKIMRGEYENKQIKNNQNDNQNKINIINSKINNNDLNEKHKNQSQNNNNDNININNSSNEYNILVINNILTESCINTSNILKSEKNNQKDKINY